MLLSFLKNTVAIIAKKIFAGTSPNIFPQTLCYNAAMICVFDIETVPDVAILREHLGSVCEGKSDLEVCQIAFDTQQEKTGSNFLPIFLHKIVAISSVITSDYGEFIKVGNFGKKRVDSTQNNEGAPDESAIIADFIHYINKHNPRLVSYNGRSFDIPTIMLRAMRYNLSAVGYYENENPQFNKSKWENYRQRYSERFHTDLLDVLGHFGSVRGMRLDDICSMMGIPGKYDMSGDLVHLIYYDSSKDIADRMEIIETYCQSDVLNTYWVLLKYELLKGTLTLNDYYSNLEKFLENLPKDKSYSEVFCVAIQKELKKAQGS